MMQSIGRLWDSLTTPSRSESRHTWLLIGIVALALFLRLWHLGTLTEGMDYDEGYKGLDGISIREHGQRPVFLDWNGGREVLVGYTVAWTQGFLDHTIASVRVISAVYGSLAVLALYFFCAQIFRRDVALIAAFLLAVSKYSIIHSRLGLRAGHFTFYEVATLCFLAAGLFAEKRRNLWLVVAGVFAGLGFHTYIAFRIFPAVVVAFLLSKDRLLRLKTAWKGALIGALLAAAILAPLAIFYLQHYQSMTDRMKRTAVWNQKGKNRDESPVALVAQATLNTLGMFNFAGDRIERHNVAGEPELSPFIGPFFLIGAALSLLCIRRRYALFLILYLLLTLVPGFLSVDSPNTGRVPGALPPALILCSLPLAALAGLAARLAAPLGTAVLAIVLGGAACTGINDALLRYPLRMDSLPPQVSNIWGLDREPARVADLMNRLGPRCEAFATPQFFLHTATEYLTYGKSDHQLFIPRVNLQTASRGRLAVVFLQQNPGMNLWFLRDDDGKRFYKWWNERYGMEIPWIRTAVRSAYGDHPQLMKTSDQRMLEQLRRNYPNGRFLDFQTFGAYILKP